METYLSPIEKPTGLGMKLAYYFTRKSFGKVLTPLKVFSARLPMAFGLWGAKIATLDKKLILPGELILLIRQKIAQINICEFCIDASRAVAIKASSDMEKFDALNYYQQSALFSDAEKAALDYAVYVTETKTSDVNMFNLLRKYFSEREICEIVYLIATEHVYNLTNIALNIHSDMICESTKIKI